MPYTWEALPVAGGARARGVRLWRRDLDAAVRARHSLDLDRADSAHVLSIMHYGYTRFLCLVALASLAPLASAQDAPLRRSLVPHDLAAFADVRLAPAASAVPDTTAPWRYFPLAVGNLWEYWTGGETVYRDEVRRDTVIRGRRYFRLDLSESHDGGPFETSDFPFYHVRFDTLSSQIVEPLIDGGERVALAAFCPFDADFGTTVFCGPSPFDVSGGHDGLLVFGAPPGVSQDSVRTAIKSYSFDGQQNIYAAGIGLVYHSSNYRVPFIIGYARVGGVTYGVSRFPTPAEAPPRRQSLSLRAWPNPSRGQLTVAFETGNLEQIHLTVRDALGREVWRSSLGVVGPGLHRAPVDISQLAPGVYSVEVRGQIRLGSVVVTRIR